MERVKLNASNIDKMTDEQKAKRGRPKGSINKVTRTLRETVILAAEAVGSDGEGTDGLLGYCTQLAMTDPKVFASLLGRVLPLHIQGSVEVEHKVLPTRAELIAELKQRGLPIETIYNDELQAYVPDSKGH